MFPGASKDRLLGAAGDAHLQMRSNYNGYQLAFMRCIRPTAALFEMQFKELPNQYVSRTDTMSQTLFVMLSQAIPLSMAGYNCKENVLEVNTFDFNCTIISSVFSLYISIVFVLSSYILLNFYFDFFF